MPVLDGFPAFLVHSQAPKRRGSVVKQHLAITHDQVNVIVFFVGSSSLRMRRLSTSQVDDDPSRQAFQKQGI